MDTLSRDRGSIVIGWLTKLIVVLAVVGVIMFDVISVSAAHIGAEDDANQAAETAGYEWRSTHDVQQAYQAALDSLPSDSESIPAKSFVIASDGTVRLTVHRLARTMIAQRIGPFEHFIHVTANGVSEPPSL